MPKGKRIPTGIKYEALSCVMAYMPPRAQARCRAVSKAVKAMVPSTVTAPAYAGIIDEMHATVASLSKGSKRVVYADTESWGMDVRFMADGKRVRVEVGPTAHGIGNDKWSTVSKCQPKHFKRVMYQAIHSKRVVKQRRGRGVVEVTNLFDSLVSGGAEVKSCMPK